MCSSEKQLSVTANTRTCAFSLAEDEVLIEMVAANPSLYDLGLNSYKNRVKKERIWKEIGSALNKTCDNCKKRWKYIKDSYNRHKRKKKLGIPNAALPKTSKWEFYDRMHFLEVASSSKDDISNIPSVLQDMANESIYDNSDDDDYTHPTIIINETEDASNSTDDNIQKTYEQNDNADKRQKQKVNITQKAAPRKRRLNKKDEFPEIVRKRETQSPGLLKQTCKKYIDDEDVDSFGEHMKSVLKKLPPILKVKAKAEIYNTMSKYELLSMELSDS